ncbi:metal-dependent hydrolase [Halobacteriales archaeon QS_1_68_20]|nr:MAG: metal-dependent hydrolase [Halobacteriales archaeon QS_1_68_20]
MVDVLGHFAFGLLWASPIWLVFDGRTAVAFVGVVLATAMLPDVDLVLRHVVPGLQHHEVTHTVLFVVVVGVVAGRLVSPVVTPTLRRWWFETEESVPTGPRVRRFVTGGLVLGGLSHVFADMLSAPDISEPVEPMWPFFDKPISVDVIYYTSPWWNGGLLVVALALHLVLAYVDVTPLGKRRAGET